MLHTTVDRTYKLVMRFTCTIKAIQMHQITKWFSICLIFAVFLVSTCLNAKDETNVKSTKEVVANDTDMAKDAVVNNTDNIDMTVLMNDCNETFRTEMSYIESLNGSGSFPDETFKTPKCFVRCLLEKSGVMSEEGVVDPERAPAFFAAQRASMAEDNFRNSTDACRNRSESCICERSYQFVRCVVETELNKYAL